MPFHFLHPVAGLLGASRAVWQFSLSIRDVCSAERARRKRTFQILPGTGRRRATKSTEGQPTEGSQLPACTVRPELGTPPPRWGTSPFRGGFTGWRLSASFRSLVQLITDPESGRDLGVVATVTLTPMDFVVFADTLSRCDITLTFLKAARTNSERR
jgi:hypothetical protein